MPDAVLAQSHVDRLRIALGHVDVVEAERRLRRVAERGVGLVRIILAEGVAVEKDVALLIFG